MFGYIHGDILAIDGITLTVLVSGIGYDILVSPSVLHNVPENKKITLWIHHHKTEVSELLFGFNSIEERKLFRDLNKVNGIGGKTALALLGLGEETLIKAIQLEDDKLLSSVPGIGKKTAQKIIVDLKGSIDFSKKSDVSLKKNPNNNDALLISSLVGMGYDKNRVEIIINDIDNTLPLEKRTIEAIRKLAQ